MLGGFILPGENIPKWWIGGYWYSLLMYAENAISVNAMLAPRWMISAENTTNLGVSALKSGNIFPQAYWYRLGVAALLGFPVLFNVLFTLALAYLKPLGKPQAVISEKELEEMQTLEHGSKQGHNRKPSRSRRGSSADDNNAFEMQISGMSNQSTSLEGNNELGLEAAATEVPPKRGMILPFKALAMSFEDVNYFADMPLEMKEQGVTDDRLQLLRDVIGVFRPGVLTALMRVNGAGKTTLRDVLAGRKTGRYIESDIRISGFPKSQETLARISGYCEQNYIHFPQVTVRESLLYSAFLRLPKDVDKETRIALVDEVIELVELYNLRDALIGLPGISELSTEQRKRLTITVELVANPSIIFMDEPTSGLDARAAAIMMRTVRNTVDNGRTLRES